MSPVSKNAVSLSSAEVQAPPQRSGVETIKEASRQLRGTIALELVTDTDHFNDQNKQLLKFHGTYQQDDRDARKTRRKEGAGKDYIFMVRCKIPGGRLTAKQYLAIDPPRHSIAWRSQRAFEGDDSRNQSMPPDDAGRLR